MATLSDFIPDASREDAQRLEEALLRGEQLRWATRPVPTLWGPGSLAALVFSIPWLAFVAFWTYASLGFPQSFADVQQLDGGRLLFSAFSIPFWLVGLAMLCQPWLHRSHMRRSLYAVTTRRVLIVGKKTFSWSTRAFPLTPELILERKLRQEGRGDLIFGTDIHYGRHNSRREIPVGFLNLPDLRRAEDAIFAALDARQGEKDTPDA